MEQRQRNSCGFTDIRALQIDHINGGGTKEFKQKNSGGIYKHILGLPLDKVHVNYQILCANCNRIKVYKNHENYIWKIKASKLSIGYSKPR